jgi:hypothetical protein
MHNKNSAHYKQIYFYDNEKTAFIHNINNQNRLNKSLLTKLNIILYKCNFYYCLYKNIREITQKYKMQHLNIRMSITL